VKRAGSALGELRGILGVLRDEAEPRAVGPVLVTGMLAEQLARELSAGADPGAVAAVDASQLARSSVLVHVIAGDPSADDDDLVRRADRDGVPVVLVQLWPQEAWTKPFVLTPFVVECRAGEGFPVHEISARIVEAAEGSVELGRRIPVLQPKVSESVVGTSMVRTAVLAALGKRSRSARPLITLEQVRMLTELRQLVDKSPAAGPDALKAAAPFAAAAVGAGFVFRGAANAAKRVLPAPIVDAAVAAAGTWALGEALRRASSRTTL
jgi:hypothetical protein